MAEQTGPDRHLVVGDAGTGKTERLVAHVAQLLKAGTPARDVLVLAPSPDAARTLERRLAQAGANGVRVGVPRLLALEVLGTEEALALTRRSPRLLANFEVNALMEDMKTSGVRPRRLKEMLRFFYRSWTELADDDLDWLISDEELEVHGLLEGCLDLMDGMLEPEVAKLAVRCLREDADLRARFARPHVAVDDYQMLSRASQRLTDLLAGSTLWAAADEVACAEVYDSYPYAPGVAAFAQQPGCTVEKLGTCRRSRAIGELSATLRASLGEDGAHGSTEPGSEAGFCELVATRDPAEEHALAADRVAVAIAAGTEPGDVYVAVPNRVWARGVAGALEARGVACELERDVRALNGDVRNEERCGAARVATLLVLAADPDDNAAWRTWCGFGDWLANSPAFTALRNRGVGGPVALSQALPLVAAGKLATEALGADERASLSRVVAAWERGAAWAEDVRSRSDAEGALRRAALLVTGSEDGPASKAVRSLCAPAGEAVAGTVYDLVARLRAAVVAPGFSERADAVRIGGLAQLAGQEPEVAVVAGFVNGFIPRHAYFDETATSPEHRESWRKTDLRRIYAAATKPSKGLVATAFSLIDATQAERLDLKADRIVMHDGTRCARVSPSIFACDMGLASRG